MSAQPRDCSQCGAGPGWYLNGWCDRPGCPTAAALTSPPCEPFSLASDRCYSCGSVDACDCTVYLTAQGVDAVEVAR